ncbi:hypothetical protein [Nocardia vaccinii]|nr:hypothetical protein [Nocardia vaccinii]
MFEAAGLMGVRLLPITAAHVRLADQAAAVEPGSHTSILISESSAVLGTV